MKKLPLVAVVALMLALAFAAPAAAKTLRGSAQDANAPTLGDIEYLFNPAGFHFWFTPVDNLGPYTAGHSYHNVYKYTVDDPAEWCTVPSLPDREPYNIGGTDGEMVYYKIWDTTTDTLVRPPCTP